MNEQKEEEFLFFPTFFNLHTKPDPLVVKCFFSSSLTSLDQVTHDLNILFPCDSFIVLLILFVTLTLCLYLFSFSLIYFFTFFFQEQATSLLLLLLLFYPHESLHCQVKPKFEP